MASPSSKRRRRIVVDKFVTARHYVHTCNTLVGSFRFTMSSVIVVDVNSLVVRAELFQWVQKVVSS